ncbi:MAG: arylformamidase [Janthinobacterium lividum]
MLWDISPPVSACTPVFPGDTPYRQRWTSTLGPDSAANVGEITMSLHVGAHADAPLHYDARGAAIGLVDLTPFLGPCRVIHAIGCGPLVEWPHLAHALDGLPPRVLVRTCEHASVERWNDDLTAFAPATIERLGALGVRLVGIDTASIDPAASTALESHQVVRRLDIRVLENLVLDAVPEGDYELVALPLKLVTADASPVRAVLRKP